MIKINKTTNQRIQLLFFQVQVCFSRKWERKDRKTKKTSTITQPNLFPWAHVTPLEKEWRAAPEAVVKTGLWPPHGTSCTIWMAQRAWRANAWNVLFNSFFKIIFKLKITKPPLTKPTNNNKTSWKWPKHPHK
jgi:hypothetical protein